MKCKICKSNLKTYLSKVYDDRYGYPKKFNLLRCENCGFIQTQPELETSQLSSLYTNYYPKRDEDINAIIRSANNIPNKDDIYLNGWETSCHLNTKRGQKVLDIGCGNCQSLLEIKKLGGIAWGIDVDKNSMKVAKKLKLKFHLGTIHNFNTKNNFFDLITGSQVLEHEINPIKFLKKCKLLLNNKGVIILSFPNTDSLSNKIFGKKWIHWHIPYHLNHFNRKSVRLLAEKSGFTIESLKTITPNLWTILQIRSLFIKNKFGKKNPLWSSTGKNTKNGNLPARLLNFLQNIILKIFNYFNFINRLIDSVGLGESFVIILKPIRHEVGA